MNQRTLEILEFNKILNNLSEYSSNPQTKERILSLKPYTKRDDIEYLHEELDQAVQLSLELGKAPVSQVEYIPDLLNRAKIDSVLSPNELLDIVSFLRVILNLIHYFKESEKLSNLNYLYRYYESFTNLDFLIRNIEKKIKSDSEIFDNASSKLAQIRREKDIKNRRIDSTLDKIVNNPNNEKYLQDRLVTIRNGRYVIPVKSGYKNQIPGTIMDRSSTGSTLFIEPLSVLELNNELNELEIEEQKEIHHILKKLTGEIKNYYGELTLNYQNLLDLDFLFAKANFALDTESQQIELTNNEIDLKKARHPLIDRSKVVTSDITINPETKILVITGPNTGGKTVSLKTIGLLTLMNQAGLFIPVKSGSKLKIFQDVYADIGDEQSIEQNLSTFSSHLTNIVDILKNNNNESLILLDELGAGTDPVEGAALAVSILDSLKDSNNLTIATTHYPEIKEYALIEENVENASVEFDVNSLRPTYRLIIGVPGRSNAFEIAKRLGLSEKIIENSKNRMSFDQLKLNESLDKAQEDRFNAQEELRRAKEIKLEAQKLFNKQKKELEKTEKQRDRIIEKAKADAKKLVNSTKRETDFIYREIQNIQSKATTQVDNKYLESLRLGIKNLNENIDSLGIKRNEVKEKNAKFEDFHKGDRVLIKSLDQEAIVSDILRKEKRIEISSGSIRMKFKPNELTILKPKKSKTLNHFKNKTNPQKMDKRLDLRGKTVNEAELLLDNFINDALVSGVDQLEVIHGFGTGKIRNLVHNYLRKSKYVKSYRLGGPGEGGGGATIIEI